MAPLALILALLAAPAAADLRVIDGDTFEADGVSYRLPDVDAPETRPGEYECDSELRQGEMATETLRRLLSAGRVEMRLTGEMCGWNRPCAILYVDGIDVRDEMIRLGLMAPWPFKGGKPQADEPDWCGGEK